jgi:hypothetical protein
MPIKSKEQRAAYDKAYRSENKARKTEYEAKWRAENAEHLKRRAAKRRLEKRAMCLIAAARVRCRKKGIEFALDGFAEDLQRRIDAGHCELSGVAFDMSPGRKPTSPSLDRRNPSEGYTPENVRVICHALNAALGDWGEDALIPIMLGWLAKRNAINLEQAAVFIEAAIECIEGVRTT